MYKKYLDGLLNHPLMTSLFVVDFFILLFHRPPFFFSFLMLGGLVAISLFLGQKLAIFKE